ncbi:Uncharacterised protein [Mycobacterium tuberculosis]|uniref:Uncharacterized protein n=1 Tax=Mycobacterium tuberculosis TaxID=1773 RepID=A0A655AHI9_MYCTX|nr:Uncharacterised protein [Mycobacterium tuberculosis]CKT04300.1 Uncharacterised protein [Mycobacterium tuberculosis]
MPTHQRHILKRREVAAPLPRRGLRHVRRRRAVLSAGRKSLDEPTQNKQDRRSDANARARRHQRHDQRTGGHQRHTERQRGPAAAAVGKPTKEPRSDGPGHEGNSEDRVDIDRRVAIGPIKELVLEIRSEHGVDVDVIPLDQIARRSPDRVPNGPTGLGLTRARWRCNGNGHGVLHAIRIVAPSDGHHSDRRQHPPCRAGAWSVLTLRSR